MKASIGAASYSLLQPQMQFIPQSCSACANKGTSVSKSIHGVLAYTMLSMALDSAFEILLLEVGHHYEL